MGKKIIKHRYREASKCADALARRGVRQSQDFVVFDSPSDVALLLIFRLYGNVI